MKTHSGTKNFKCDICAKPFLVRGNMIRHKETHLENREPSYKCNECGLAFLSIQGLHYHVKTHGTKDFTCELCQKLFLTGYLLDKHKVIHSVNRK